MHRPLLGFAAALAIVTLAPAGQASAQQFGADPFSLYYGYYLPHAAAVAAQPSPLDSINQMTARRQQTAETDRAGLYDPISPYAEDDLEGGPGGRRRGGERKARAMNFGVGQRNVDNTNTRGNGPSMYYNRTAQWFPTARVGRGPNRNVVTLRGNRGGGGMGMPSAPNPNPGVR